MKYSLGLDIGTTSVGWAVIDLDKKRIHDLGVRIFEGAEHPKTGDPLAKPRREARGTRRRLKRRRQRLNHLKQFFIDQNILTRQLVEDVLDPKSRYNGLDIYALRDKAFYKELSPEELLKVLYQISKRRGFKSNRKVIEETDKQGEGGAVTRALQANEAFLADKGYQTVGIAFNRDKVYATRKRNGSGTYSNSFARADFLHELEAIIQHQKQYALKHVSDESINELIYGIDNDGNVINQSAIMYQRPFVSEELIKKMVGKCTFEQSQERAPRASYSFELFRLASELSHLTFTPKDKNTLNELNNTSTITLSSEQIAAVINMAKKGGTLTYAKVRKAAGIDESYVPSPNHVRGKITDDDPYGEGNDFGNLKAYHDIRLALKNLPTDWCAVDNENILNEIAYILTVQKSDEEIRKKLNKLPISDEAAKALLKIRPTHFKAFGHLSIKALQKITPHILAGNTYDKACKLAGYDFRKKTANLEDITNPVVKRSITQTAKVVRAITKKYGEPYAINVETARDLAKNRADRNAIADENKENQAYNDDIKEVIELGYEATPKTKGGARLLHRLREFNVPLHKNADFNGQQITKIKLYDEQNGKCLYSGKSIDFNTMIHDDNAYQIDHIVPRSRSNNDGLTNKALVLTEENQKKANRTPYEYFGNDEVRWQQYITDVESIYRAKNVNTDDKLANKLNYKFNSYAHKKRHNLLLTEYKDDAWGVSHLQSTRYITKFIHQYLDQTVDFAPREKDNKAKRIFTPNGTITSYLRKRWGLSKIREEDVLHHAADAAIVGAIDDKIIYQANIYAKKQEIVHYLSNAKTLREKTNLITGEIVDEELFTKAQQENMAQKVLSEKHFPEPWTDFAKEVRKRTLNKDTLVIQNELRGLGHYDEAFRLNIRPIFVSRMPNRKVSGRAHEDTIYSANSDESNMRTIRKPLVKIHLKDLENSPVKNTDPQLYNSLRERLKVNNDNPEKAFAPNKPIFKNDKYGKPTHQVRAIKVASKQNPSSGFILRDNRGFVNNGEIVRLDIYSKSPDNEKKKYYFVPILPHHIPKEKAGEKITKILPSKPGCTDIDGTFNKEMSIFKNDYVRIHYGDEIKEGYFRFYESDGRLNLMTQTNALYDKKTGRASGSSATLIARFDISILGDNAPRD